MIERIGEPAMLELLGERCLKLAELAFKQARIKRNQEPTLATEEEISAYMADEWTYVCGFADELKLVVNEPLMKSEETTPLQQGDQMTVFDLIKQLTEFEAGKEVKFRVKGDSKKNNVSFNGYAYIDYVQSNSERVIFGLNLEIDETKLCVTCNHRCRGAFEWACDCNKSELFYSQIDANDSCDEWEERDV